ncbi:aconitate hydratase AcnA [Candidatus Comchoanobacter bicostacola]|uniref:Aconitate hydratase n=1 Tax=Candidatus Comchoanobacter bicostacola TaxID=2919598 RepID=A0ABY5DKT6_9GAMM|nr:aconitate hydratase AcnA [Candidatus Comchoanobacter bicostacola]UTC24431.1 aconitate hydratase AcnA [Candidatus Comchoanobacter bicostacola]
MVQGRISVDDNTYHVIDISQIAYWSRLPYSLKILLENACRNQLSEQDAIVDAFKQWVQGEGSPMVNYYPGRVLMQDLTGVPALVDLAAMRDACKAMGHDPSSVNPLCRVDLVADHSVTVNHYGQPDALEKNTSEEVVNNEQRYSFLKWAQSAFDGVRIVPPGKGICHQVNLEYLATVVENNKGWLYPDTLVGLDSHTTMINGISVLGWGVGGIEAEAAMLGQPIRMVIPEVLGIELKGALRDGVTATDMVLSMTQFLRGMNVVGKFVEFYGEGLEQLDLAERATIANMAPEYGATSAFFPCDQKTLDYLNLTGRDPKHIGLVEVYLKEMQLFYDNNHAVEYSQTAVFDLSEIYPCIAGPKRPEQLVLLPNVPDTLVLNNGASREQLSDGSVVIAAITSCTNTSNPSVLIGAGLMAKKANELGLSLPKWVKPSLAPGSTVVMQYLNKLGLVSELEQLGFYLVGYGCTTCIGNSGPLDEWVAQKVKDQGLNVCSVLSGNRNFEGRVHPQTQFNYLASPLLVVAYAIAGTMALDLSKDPVGYHKGQPIYLHDIWPAQVDIDQALMAVSQSMFKKEYATIEQGGSAWDRVVAPEGLLYDWDQSSTYIKKPPFLTDIGANPSSRSDVSGAHILALFGDNVTTDHISPAGHIAHDSPAAEHLLAQGVEKSDFNSYGSRRGNSAIMVRATFANPRVNNLMLKDQLGGYTRHMPSGEVMSIYDASTRYQKDNCDLVLIAGSRYGTGSSRDWAAKGTMMLGVKVVIAQSFERIHRSNLLGMGVLPCQFVGAAPELTGSEKISIKGIADMSQPQSELIATIDGSNIEFKIRACLETDSELLYYQQGGILPYVLRRMTV